MKKDQANAVRSSWSDLAPDMLELLEAKVLFVESAFRRRKGGIWTEETLHVLFLHYLLGVTRTVMPDATPNSRMGLLQRLAASVLNKDQIDKALFRRIDVDSKEMSNAFSAAILMGNRDGTATLIQFNQ